MNQGTDSCTGFTLIEMMITVSIASLLLALAVPSFKSLISENNVVTSTNDLTSSIRMARSEAIKRGERTALCPSNAPLAENPTCASRTNWTKGWIVFVDTNMDGFRSSNETLLAQMPPRPPAMEMNRSSVFGQVITFSSGGNTISTFGAPRSGLMSVVYDDETRFITLQANGRLSVSETLN